MRENLTGCLGQKTQEGRKNAFEKVLGFVAEKMAWIAMLAIVACMALVVTDVIRYQAIHKPIPGTHEVVELIASVILSMGIGYLTFVKGHVAVGLIVDRFRPRDPELPAKDFKGICRVPQLWRDNLLDPLSDVSGRGLALGQVVERILDGPN